MVYRRIRQSYSKFQIFFIGKKLTFTGLLESLIFIVRRVIFVASALYFSDKNSVLAALGIFMVASYMKLTYIIAAKPFESEIMILQESFNELTVLLFGYLGYVLTD